MRLQLWNSWEMCEESAENELDVWIELLSEPGSRISGGGIS